jgi:hypothetical protein
LDETPAISVVIRAGYQSVLVGAKGCAAKFAHQDMIGHDLNRLTVDAEDAEV